MKSVSDLNDEEVASIAAPFFRSRAKNDAHEHILRTFHGLSASTKINQAFLARRLGKDPASINRLLAAPGNWTLDTYAELLMAMGRLAVFDSVPINQVSRSNECPVNHERAVYAQIASGPKTNEPCRLFIGQAKDGVHVIDGQRSAFITEHVRSNLVVVSTQ